MKKSLLFGAALLCAATVNAQVYQVVAEDLGITSTDKETPDAIDAGFVFYDGDAMTISNAFATGHITTDCKNNHYNQIFIDGNLLVTVGGIQGQDNPKDADGATAGSTMNAPVSGAVVQFVPKKDGYIYIFGKLSSNKNYYVYEEGTPVVFSLGMQVASDFFPEGKIAYTAEGDADGYLTDVTYMNWPEKVALGDGWEAAAGDAGKIGVNGLGYICFKAYEGLTYLVGAGGSKISWCGAYYSENEVQSIVLKGTDEENPVADYTLLGEGGEVTPVDPEPEPEPAEETEVLSLENSYFWGTGTLEGNVVTFTDQWDGLAWWLGEKEGVTKIVVEYEEATTITTQLLCQFNDIEDQSAQAAAGATSLSIDLPAGSMKQFAIQNAEPGVIKVKSVTLYLSASSISAVAAEANNTVVFNLNGQKANAAKGLMIRNGKVIMVK